MKAYKNFVQPRSMKKNNNATLILCLKRSFTFKGLNAVKKLSCWRLFAESFMFFALENFFLSLPNVGILKRLCPSSSVSLEILSLLIYTFFTKLAIFLVLFVAGLANAVILFLVQRRYRFLEITKLLFSHVPIRFFILEAQCLHFRSLV